MKVGIVTDSTCDLPDEQIKQLGVTVVPLFINIGDTGFKDGVDISREEFYANLPSYASHPTTGTPGTAAFVQAYQALAAKGVEAIISIHISQALSAVLDSARSAASEFSTVPVMVRDSRQLSMGTGFQVELAAQLAAQGKTVEEILSALDSLERRTFVAAALDTLEFLRRGGRMNGVMAGLGSVLQIKPILTMRSGVPGSERVRTTSKAEARLLSMVTERGQIERLVLLHSNAPERANKLRTALLPYVSEIDPQPISITPVIGAHVGPGAAGFALITKD